ncbi:MAG: hypothetical protein CO189_00615 [candidate division Zixibacteria bacterium CG_4_9_14_3_um_filter_46_8]|nr:MAG: hypothetical protein CO189_00615 [candidate division Zixibacteria bacterium CG_4_9_14_3_um_filter_46_8]
MNAGKYISFIIVPDEGDKTFNFRVSKLALWIFLTVSVISILIIMVAAIFYGRLIISAIEVKSLRTDNQALLQQHREFLALKDELERNRAIVNRISELAGLDSTASKTEPAKQLSAPIPEDSAIGFNRFIPKGRPLQGYLSKRFSDVAVFGEKHLGLDITCPEGSPVHATADGIVEFAGWDDYFGYVVRIEHQQSYMTIYAHNKELLVSKGDRVKRAQEIALSGNSGNSSGPHLHYEVLKNGKPMDPEGFL